MDTIKKVCVIGAGTMGKQIALNSVTHGYQVTLTDAAPSVISSACEWCSGYLNKSVELGKMTKEESDAALQLLQPVDSIEESVKDADLVIEAIIEKEDIKRELFANLNRWTRPDTILTSNSSYIPTSRYLDIIDHPERLANLHFFNPAMRMKLVEIVRGEHTGTETVRLLQEFVKKSGKTSILVNKEIEGFVVNRLLYAVQDEAYHLLETGVASFSDIDLGAELGLNWPMGPFRIMDLTGLDINYYNRQRKYNETGREEDKPPLELTRRFEAGKYGRKTGEGWYTY